MNRAATIVQNAVTLVMATATVVLGFTLPAIWGMSGDIGGLRARSDEFSRRFDGFDRKLDGIDAKLDTVGRRVESIEVRLSQRDTDPSSLVAQSGLRPISEFAGARIGEKLFVLPRSDKAQAELVNLGLSREPITPTIYGYLLGEYDVTGTLRLKASQANIPTNR